jgi:5-methylcytosine-specific restriction protein A
MLDRMNPVNARSVAERLLPDPTIRIECLRSFAESVAFAHDVNPERWGVTLLQDAIRLNVGRIEVLTLVAGEFHLLLHRPSISTTTRTSNLLTLDEPEGGFYKSVPESVACNFGPEAITMILPMVRDSHHNLIRDAAILPLNPASKHAHSPGVIQFLVEDTGITLVDPWYPGDAREQ